MALRLLSRSAAALVAQQLGPAAQRLPSDWNPFASLAGESEACSHPHAGTEDFATSWQAAGLMPRMPVKAVHACLCSCTCADRDVPEDGAGCAARCEDRLQVSGAAVHAVQACASHQ